MAENDFYPFGDNVLQGNSPMRADSLLSNVSMDPTPDRRHDVNANLRKIKQEKDANLAQWNDSGDMFSQIPNQDYYLKLDKSLANLPRSLYIDELLSLCCNDVKTINWYRSYLADQARKSPECPASRLVKRKNTVNRSNSQQCATDCYILRMFIDGERSAEINTVFSQAGPTIETPSDDLNYSMYDTQKDDYTATKLHSPPTGSVTEAVNLTEIAATMMSIRMDIGEIKEQRRNDANLISDLGKNIKSLRIIVDVIHASVNGMRSMMSNLDNTIAMVRNVDTSLENLSTTVTNLSRNSKTDVHTQGDDEIITIADDTNDTDNTYVKELYSEVTANKPAIGTKSSVTHNVPSTVGVSKDVGPATRNQIQPPTANVITQPKTHIAVRDISRDNNVHVDCVDKEAASSGVIPTYPSSRTGISVQSVTDSYSATNTESTKNNGKTVRGNDTTSKNTNATAKNGMQHSHYARNNDNAKSTRGFVAMRRNNVNTYYIGNVDESSTEDDLKVFLHVYHITPTQVTMYRNRGGASIRVSIPDAHAQQVESDGFWPDGMTCRRWMASKAWTQIQEDRKREYEERKRSRQNTYYYENREHGKYNSSNNRYTVNECDNRQPYDRQARYTIDEHRREYDRSYDRAGVSERERDSDGQKQWVDWFEQTELADEIY
ncbi:MAG: hypothetical protein ABW185_01380 [Sedimenticola sp.]